MARAVSEEIDSEKIEIRKSTHHEKSILNSPALAVHPEPLTPSVAAIIVTKRNNVRLWRNSHKRNQPKLSLTALYLSTRTSEWRTRLLSRALQRPCYPTQHNYSDHERGMSDGRRGRVRREDGWSGWREERRNCMILFCLCVLARPCQS